MTDFDDLPEARTGRSRGISLIWLIPLVAAIAGGWLAYKAIREKGPLITIEFDHAEGVEAGKTHVKYKDVDVGKVKKVRLNSDLSKVVISVQMARFMEGHLNENTRFWIVSPRITQSGVSGLSTLISGIHIGMDTAPGEHPAYHFTGLERAPEIDSSSRGKRFVLNAETLGSLDIGSPVYYRKIQVGEVTQYALSPDGKNVNVQVFIHAPYDKLVHVNSRFWNASGFNLKFDTDGINANLESLMALISGGIAFDTPTDLKSGQPARSGATFALHASRTAVDEGPYQIKKYFTLHFDSSLRGLSKGAPVEFRGIKVGEVLDIDLNMDADTLAVHTPVLIGIYTDRIRINGTIPKDVKVTDTLVKRGLRAQLKSGNLLTGQLYVDLEFVKNAPKAEILYHDGAYPEFPTVPAAFDKITRNATELLDKIGQIPVLEISEDLRQTIKGLRNIVASKATQRSVKDLNQVIANIKDVTDKLDRHIDPVGSKLESSLAQLEKTLQTANQVLGEDSPLYYDLRQLIDELSSAARSFENLTDFLERHPNALLLGKPEN